jgi:hypothetical protein
MAMKWLPPMIAPRRIDDAELVEAIVRMIERKTPDIFGAQMKALLAGPMQRPYSGASIAHSCWRARGGWSPPLSPRANGWYDPGSKLV